MVGTQSISVSSGQVCKLDAQIGTSRIAPIFRSAILPGWGQSRPGSKKETSVFLLGAIGSGVLLYIAQDSYLEKLDVYNSNRQTYLNAVNEADALKAADDMRDSHSHATRAYWIRNVTLSLAAGWYTLNLVDVALFHSRAITMTVSAVNQRPVSSSVAALSDVSAELSVQVKF